MLGYTVVSICLQSQKPFIKMEDYRKCFVPTCKNDTKNSSKTIVRIREDLREKWCREANVEYFKVYTQYCCEDHFDPNQDLTNIYFKLEKQEPRFKPTAKLRNIGVNVLEELPSQPSGSQPEETQSVLAKLLLHSKPESKKRKFEETNMPSTSSYTPVKVQVAVQATAIMTDKSTNTRFKANNLGSTAAVKIHSSQQSSSTSVADSQSLFSFTSETEEPDTLFRKEFDIRQINLEKIYKKPKMYLGLPKQYSAWLIDFVVKKSSSKIDPLCIIATLLKIKQNDTIERISDELEVSRTKLSTMILNGVEALSSVLQNFIVMPQSLTIKRNLPLVFKMRYSNVQMIIDCFEIQISKPSHPLRQSQTWSQYKNCNTIKYLIGCTPDGFINFISKGEGGRISDKAIVEKSNLLDVLQPNAVVLADRGFKEIECLLNARGIKLLRPPSVFSGVKQTAADTLKGKVIASLRIHIERAIRRVREFSILKPHSVVHYKHVPYLDEIVIIACGLINLQDELIKCS